MSEESLVTSDPGQTRVAFIGLGHMGGPMAANLVRAGYRVRGFDVVPAALTAAAAAGVVVAASSAEAAAGADVIITMLPAGKHVFAAFEGEGTGGGLLAAAQPGALFLECSTISVEDALTAHEMVVASGHRGLDAPVSGGVVGAEAGTLTFMVGGSEADFAAAAPIFEVMGKRIVHCGGPGAGQAAKVCNNMILGVSMIAVSEAFVLGEKLGLTHEALYEVAANASGQCWALTTNCPVPGPVPTSPANRDYQPGFAGALMAKDLGLAVEALNATGVDAVLGRAAEEIYREFSLGGGDTTDFSGIINTIRAASKHRG
ncbi:3-hydroxyisobutyrate dehydrogenase [Arthrobacter psychrolactophilus]|uniref:3-hydroxyisobutyrate dehydrogenase n=1 Tax=Arthrobacter psychrolactophilus TaxID=92442 RepID=A0A2V5ITP0_9MICC|nr:3-hydroxyisobutyrate dehydrogenase [Arthrobacter psychrolactophilus]PYI39888.1 3-hydroxyisobutyrate dehydrogenase [Arthrobacter psychrolactophilus]